MDISKNISDDIQAKEPTATTSKTKSQYNIYRYKTRKINTYADDFVFVRKHPLSADLPIVPLMAGITKASPDYYINLRHSGFREKNLVVIEFVVSGSGYIEHNGLTTKVSAGDFYILSPEFDGSYYPDPQDPFVKKWVNINGQLTPRLLKAYGIRDTVFKMHFDGEKYMDEMHDVLADYNENDSTVAGRKLSHILLELFMEIRHRLDLQRKDAPIEIKDIRKYIRDNISHRELTVESICNTFYIGRRTLDRLFNREMGITPIKYITNCKIEFAQQMLAEGLSIEEVSDACGFSSPTYFRKVFTSVCEESPQKYKQRMKNKITEG